MSYIPNVGEKFLMDFPLTPALQEEYGTDSLIIEASYEGTLSSQEIEVQKAKKIKPLNYNIPSYISSGAFFIVLTALSNNCLTSFSSDL